MVEVNTRAALANNIFATKVIVTNVMTRAAIDAGVETSP